MNSTGSDVLVSRRVFPDGEARPTLVITIPPAFAGRFWIEDNVIYLKGRFTADEGRQLKELSQVPEYRDAISEALIIVNAKVDELIATTTIARRIASFVTFVCVIGLMLVAVVYYKLRQRKFFLRQVAAILTRNESRELEDFVNRLISQKEETGISPMLWFKRHISTMSAFPPQLSVSHGEIR